MNLYLQMGSNHFHETRHNESLNVRPLPGTPMDNSNYERDIAEVLRAIGRIPYRADPEFIIREQGLLVTNSEWYSSGRYLLSRRKVACGVRCMYSCCARRKNTSEYFTMKILNLKNDSVEILTQDDIQGMFIMHNEYMLLKRLKDKDGVYRVHDYFKEFYNEEEMDPNAGLAYTGKVKVRICLVLDHVVPIVVQPECKLENLQQHVLKKRVLTELEAARIFQEILLVVKTLHNNNVVHRDLKLSNIRFDKETLKVVLINFGLGHYLPSLNTMITDQRGSPAYISPDILTTKPYAPKPSDMWSLGVSFYVMIMGSFPFYDTKSKQLFNKIIKGSYMIPLCGIEKLETVELIKGLLSYNPEVRISIDAALRLTSKIINDLSAVNDEPMQIVPDLETSDEEAKPKESEIYRWKFSVLQHDNRLTLRQDLGSQVPILHLTADEQRVKAIEMRHVRSCIETSNTATHPPATPGIFNRNPIKIKPESLIVDQVVPEIEIEEVEIKSFTKPPQPIPKPEAAPKPKPKVKPKPKSKGEAETVGVTNVPSASAPKRVLRSNVSLKNVNIRSLLK